MANNATFTMTFKVREDGSLVAVEKNINRAGKSVKDLSAAQEAGSKSADRHSKAVNGGVASANNAGRSMSKLLETVGGNNSGLVAAYATLATNAFAVSAAFSVLRNASQAEQVMKGLEVQGARLGVTLTNTAKGIQEISRGSLSMADSMQAAAQASAAGFTTKNITDLTIAAQNASIALGRNMPDSLDRMIKGTTKLEPELLDELGVMVKLTEANNKYALANGKTALSLTATEKRQAFLNAVLEESNRKFGGLSEQVDANPYDRLAATFDNLVKNFVYFIDTSLGVRAAVGFLADNTGALVAVLVLFASTISRQLIPSLYQMSEAALQNRDILEKRITTQMRSVKATLAQAAADREAAKANQLSSLNLQKAPSQMQAYVKAVMEGVNADEQKAKALKQINSRIYYQTSQQKKIADTESDQYKARQATIDQLRAYKDKIVTLTQAEVLHANTVSAAESKAEVLRQQNRGMRLKAAAQVAAANAIEAGSTYEVGKAYTEGRKAVALYAGGVEKSSNAMLGSLQNSSRAWIQNAASSNIATASWRGATTVVRASSASFFAASIAVKTLGAALLNMVPIIGQLLLVWELLKSAYSYVKELFFPDPAGTKQLEAAVEAHKEILKSTQDTAKVTSGIFGDTGRSSAAITQGLTAVSNKVNEVVDSYREVEKRQSAIGKDATKQLADPAKAINIVSGKTAKEEAKAAVESISALRTLGYAPLVKEIDEVITTNKEFWDSTGQEQAATASKVLDKIKKKYGELGDTTKSIDDNYKKISASYDAFVTVAAVKTPFDDLVKNWDEQVILLDKLQKQLEAGTISLEDFGKKINQIRNDSTVQFIDDKSIQQLQYLKDLEAFRAKQQEIYDSGRVKSGVEQLNLLRSIDSVTAKITEEEGRLGIFIKDAQLAAAAELVSKQKSYVLSQGELKVIQAKLQANASIMNSGEEGLRLRLKLEKESRDIQINSLKIQKSIIDAKIASSQAELKASQDFLDFQARQLVNEKKNTAEIQKQSALRLGVEAELLVKGAALMRERGAGNAGNGAQVGAQKAYLAALAETDSAEKALTDRVVQRSSAEKALDIQNRQAALSSLSLEKEIQAMQQQSLSSAKTQALISQARLNRIAKEREDNDSLLEQNLALQEVEKKRSVLLAGNADSFSEELRSIKEAANADRRRLLSSYEAQRLRLLGEIGVAQQDVNEASAEEAAAAKETLASANLRLQVLDSTTAATLAQKDAETDLAIQTKIYVDTRKLGLDLQQQSLEFLQKEVDLTSELARTRLNTAQINKEISLKRQGLYKTEEQQQAFEIQTATQTYQLVVKEAALKKSLIELEFALLDGQREVLKQQLLERKSEMLSAGYSKDDTAVRQLTAAIDNISNAPTGASLAEKAKQQVDENIEQLGATLKNIITTGGSAEDPITKMIATIRGIEEKRIAREEAKAALQVGVRSDPVAQAVVESSQKQINVTKVGVARSNELLEQIAANTEKNAAASLKEAPVANLVGGIKAADTPAQMARKVADLVAADPRVKVSEIGGYGRVGKHGEGSMHYTGRAFDLNVPGVGDEASNARAKAILDQKAIEISKTGMEVLWNGVIYRMGQAVGKIKSGDDQHTDHLHAEVDSQSYKLMRSLYSTMASAAAEGAAKAANDNQEIVVTAASPIVPALKPFAGPNLPPLDIGPLPDFTQYSDTNWDAIRDRIAQVSVAVDTYAEKLKALGPDGEVVAALAQGSVVFASSWTKALKTMDSTTATTGDKIAAIASAISSSIGAVQSITQAASNAKIANIDREIAAEEKRDGKSAQSVAKLDALEKKKDSIARKQFNLNKKLMMAQAIMSTAAGVAGALAASGTIGPIAAAIMAGVIGAMGVAQIALIAGTQYESSYTAKSATMPANLSIGKRSDTIDLAKGPNASAGGEVGYLRGSAGTGSNASNYRTTGSAYGGELMRGYGNRGFVVGEKGPEVITPETPITVTPANDIGGGQPINASFNIHAIDSQGVQDVLVAQKGNIIKMLREAANASGKSFMEDVNVNVYTRPSVGKL